MERRVKEKELKTLKRSAYKFKVGGKFKRKILKGTISQFIQTGTECESNVKGYRLTGAALKGCI